MLRATHLTAGYPRTPLLTDATFALTPDTITGLVGANGSGKSTLVRTLVGLLPPLSCESLSFDGTDLAHFRHGLRCRAYGAHRRPALVAVAEPHR